MSAYTLAHARLILSHVYCVGHLPTGDGWVYPWSHGAGELSFDDLAKHVDQLS